MSLGIKIEDQTKDKIAFLSDPRIITREVNKTCERCSISDCKDRASAPIVIQERERRNALQNAISQILD